MKILFINSVTEKYSVIGQSDKEYMFPYSFAYLISCDFALESGLDRVLKTIKKKIDINTVLNFAKNIMPSTYAPLFLQ